MRYYACTRFILVIALCLLYGCDQETPYLEATVTITQPATLTASEPTATILPVTPTKVPTPTPEPTAIPALASLSIPEGTTPTIDGVMDEEEWKTFQSLPEEITIYRGRQAKKAKIRGLSWTIDKKQAEWFALRWKNDEGELYSAVINKKDVFAYFSQEKEIVVNPGKIKKLKKIEIGK